MRLIKNLTCSIFPLMVGCSIADISNSALQSASNSSELATQKLESVVSAQGFEALKEKNIYTYQASDDWPGLLGNMAKLWPDQKTEFEFKHTFNTFDGSAKFLDGKRKGDIVGLQSWHFYEQESGKDLVEVGKLTTEYQKYQFGLAAFHYFLELPFRLSNAPYKKYYGKDQLNGNEYDLVFVSWVSEDPHEDFDQYIVWINAKTDLIDFCLYTLRDNKNPLTRNKYGSIAYTDYRDVEGFHVPYTMSVMIDDGVLHSNFESEYFHQLKIHEFQLGGFDESELYPLPGIEKVIDSK